MELGPKNRHSTPQQPAAQARTPRRITSKALLDGRNVLIIEHDGRDYLLRVTHQGKLILTA
jgi:hemin uptake protein HemP